MSASSPGDSYRVRTSARLEIRLSWLVAAVVALWAYTYLPWLGALDLQFEEPRRVLVAKAMLDTGEFWTPELAGEPYTAKPPLFNWALAASAAVHGGFDEWSARVPSVACVLLLALLFVWGARGVLGRWALAFFGVSLVLAPEIVAKGRIAEIEPLFALLVATSLGSWLLLYRAGAAGVKLWVAPLVLVALAYLTKREPAVVFFYFGVGPFLLLRGRWRALLEPGHLVGIGVAAVLVSGWLLGMASETGWLALWETLRTEVLERGIAGQSAADIATHIVTYPIGVWFGMLPFSALLPLLAAPSVRARVRERFGEAFTFCVLAVLVNLPVYWFRGDVAVRYFLPMFPFMLLIAAMVFDVLRHDVSVLTRPVRRYLGVVHWSVAGVAVLCAVLLVVSIALPRYVDGHETLLPAAVAVALAAAGVAAVWRLCRRRAMAPMPVLLLLCCTMLVLGRSMYFNVAFADRLNRYEDDRNAPRIAAGLRERIAPDAVVYARGVPWEIWYYADAVALEPLSADTPPGPGSWILVDEKQRAEAEPLGFPAEAAARFSYKDDVLLLGRVRGAPAERGASRR